MVLPSTHTEFAWQFVVADVTHPIIGVDFLSHFGLLVDCRNNRIQDGVTTLSAMASAGDALILSVKTISNNTPVDNLLTEHEQHLRALFNQLQRYEIIINLSKYTRQ